MSYDDDLKQLLVEIDTDNFKESSSLPNLSRTALVNLIRGAEEEGFLSHSVNTTQPLLSVFHEGFLLHPTAYVPRKGKKFIEGEDRNISQQNVTIGSVHGSNIGNHGIVNNYMSENPILDLKDYISTLQDSKDKSEASEMLSTLESQELKPGMLSRFDTVIGKYPEITKLVGNVLTVALVTGLK